MLSNFIILKLESIYNFHFIVGMWFNFTLLPWVGGLVLVIEGVSLVVHE